MDRKVAINYMHDMLRMLKNKGGSDLYINAGAAPSMKIHGAIKPVTAQKLSSNHTQQLVRSIMNDKQAAEFDSCNECNFAISLPDVSRFRVNAYVQRSSVAMVVRLISNHIPSFDDLHLPDVLRDIAMFKRGLVMLVGGTGAGKSTTLASMIDLRNQLGSGHIISIEDPVEFVHQHKGCLISQREVGTDTESFGIALKNSLRQAPDVIMIGEIRDRETMEHAITFAETGHLCLATLHANNTNQALDRIINFFPEDRRHQLLLDLSLNLRALISQRLLRTVDDKSRRAAIEILLNTPLMSDLILKGEVHEMKDLMKKSTEAGMKTFDQALFELVEEDAITIDEAMRNADSLNDLRLRIKLESKHGGELDMSAYQELTVRQESKDHTGMLG